LDDFSHERAKVLWSLRYDETSGAGYTCFVNDSKETRCILEQYKHTVSSQLPLIHTPPVDGFQWTSLRRIAVAFPVRNSARYAPRELRLSPGNVRWLSPKTLPDLCCFMSAA